MKKGFLKLFLAFSIFLFVGMTYSNAQDFVSRTEAMTIVKSMAADAQNANDLQGKTLLLKLIYKNLENGMEVPIAVKTGHYEWYNPESRKSELTVLEAEFITAEIMDKLKK